MTTALYTGMILGLMGSFHCAVMCGPIALALPVGRSGKYVSHLLHQSGRILTYLVLGALAGSIGEGLSLVGWQQPLSIAIGILLILGLISKWPTLMRWAPYRRVYSRLQHSFVTRLRGGKSINFLFTGMINGLLPCGLVYAAMLGSLGTGNMLSGMSMMLGFGLGTGVILLLIGWGAPTIIEKLKGRVRFAIPVVVGLMAIFFILRGMGLGIPYVSPQDEALQIEIAAENPPSCH